jgi:thymidylate kinase
VTDAASFVVVVGPDGAGKSALARALVERHAGAARQLHWRPEVLPRIGSLVGRAGGDPAEPHADPPRPRAVSTVFLLYYWLDFFLGWWIVIRPAVDRGELVVMERGWYDFAVDPRRYRLNVSPRLVRLLGRLLPSPGVVLVLDADERTLLERKRELPADELARQRGAWREMRFRRSTRAIVVDASMAFADVLDAARAVISDPEPSAFPGRRRWVGLPPTSRPRWYLPSASHLAASSLLVYHPVTSLGRVGWSLGYSLAAHGALHLMPSASLPPEIITLLSAVVDTNATVTVARTNHEGRYVALVIAADGEATSFAKIAVDAGGAAVLAEEAVAIRRVGALLNNRVFAPALRHEASGLMVLDAVEWRPRHDPWRLPPEVAQALGDVFAATADAEGRHGAGHGDLAPWNLLHTKAGWALIDWEDARFDLPPLYDVFHFLVQSHLDLHRPSKRAILDAVRLRGRLVEPIRAYSDAAGIDPSRVSTCFERYLRVSSERLDPAIADHRPGLLVRRRLGAMLRG